MKKVLAAIFAGMFITSVFAVDLTLRATPSVNIPLGNIYSTGFGGTIQADADLFGFMTAGLEGSANIAPISALNNNSSFLSGGAGIGAYYFPLSRLYLGAGAGAGLYQISTKIKEESTSFVDFYFRGYGEVGFRVSPSLTISGTGGFTSYLVNGSKPIMNAINAGVGVRYTIPLNKKASSTIQTAPSQDDAVFPLFMRSYKDSPLGSLVIKNNEGAELRNVHVSFRAGRYTASTYESAVIPKINKHSSINVDLYSDFSGEILKYTENGKIAGEVVLDYELLGKKMQTVQNAVISVYNRNAFSWLDPAALSAFISAETPEVFEIAKYIAGIARNNFYTGMDRNLQMAAAMLEGLRAGGITYSGDKITPYLDYHVSDEIDYIQYPLQTLNYLGGDYDDIGILLASCLESVGVPTAFLVTDNDFILLVATNAKPGTEENLFASADTVISDGTTIYFGLSMVNFEKGFAKSRAVAAEAIKEILNAEDTNAVFVSVEDSWAYYPPAVFTENGAYFTKPASNDITTKTNEAIKDYMNTDLSEVLARARKTNDSNKIGVALMRLGRYDEAKKEFTKANSTKALNNLATIYMIEKNYAQAAETYKKVLTMDASNKIATKGLENANAKLEK